MKSEYTSDICTPMFIAALFTIPGYRIILSAHQEMNGNGNDIFIHNGILFSHERIKVHHFVTAWKDLQDIMLSAIIQAQKSQMLHDLLHTWKI
jgi:hypothetical protein